MASQDVGQRKLLDDEAAASRDIKQARIGQTVEREPDRRAREPLGELLKGSSEIRSPGSISPDEHLSQVQQGATGLRSDFGAGPPVRPSGTLTMNASRIVIDHRRVGVQIHPAIAIARYRQPRG